MHWIITISLLTLSRLHKLPYCHGDLVNSKPTKTEKAHREILTMDWQVTDSLRTIQITLSLFFYVTNPYLQPFDSN